MNASTKQRIAILAALAAVAMCISGCTANPDEGAEQTTTAATTAAPEESSEEETTTTVTQEEPEESEPEESEPDEEPEESEPDDSEEEPDDSEEEPDEEPSSDELMTQLELITYINQKFGMILPENTPEANIDAARSWNFIDDTFEADAPITPEMTVNAIVKAADFADADASLKDVTKIALENGIIDNANIEKLDLTKAKEMVDYAADLWAHGAFIPDPDEVKATGDVIDLTDVISSGDISYVEDGVASIPVDVAEDLKPGKNVKLPADSSGNGGGVYFVSAVAIINGEATIQIEPVD